MSSVPEGLARPKVPDYRSASHRSGPSAAAIVKAVDRATWQREALVEIAETLGEWPPPEVGLKFSLEDSADVVGEILRAFVGLDLIKASELRDPAATLRLVVRHVEQKSVLVIQVRDVDWEEMRGFSLAFDHYPVVALNSADSPRGKVFTLLHELAHVGFRTSGLCDQDGADSRKIERKCDEAAAAALMPRRLVQELGFVSHEDLDLDRARSIGQRFGASGEAAVRRLVELGIVPPSTYESLRPRFAAAYRAWKASDKETRELAKEEGKGAPIYYPLKARDMGRAYIRRVHEAYDADVISSRDVSDLLGVAFDKIPKLMEQVGVMAR